MALRFWIDMDLAATQKGFGPLRIPRGPIAPLDQLKRVITFVQNFSIDFIRIGCGTNPL